MDIALQMGGKTIIMVGQDLAYSDNRKHVSGHVHVNGQDSIKPINTMRTVKSANGETLYTTLGLLSFKRWIENRIQDEPDKKFINATEGGAFIKGAEHKGLGAAIEQYLKEDYKIDEMIQNIIDKVNL